MTQRRAVVLGAGIAGLSAAIALRQAGYDVAVHERASALEPVGAALSLWPNAMAALAILGADQRIASEAAPIASIRSATREGRSIFGPLRISDIAPGTGRAYLPTRALLQSALLECLGETPLHLGRTVVGIDEAPRPVVRFADGDQIAADLVIDATGIWSATATALVGNAPAYCGYGGVVALSDPLPSLPSGMSSEYWGAGERFGLFDAGGGRRYWFYMRNQPATAAADWEAIVDRAAGWPVEVGESIRATPPAALAPFAIHARAVPRRLGGGRILCMGDAAHAMEPNLGQGACQALEDAAALALLARRHAPDRLLAAFERVRLKRIATFVRRSRHGSYGAHAGAMTRAAMRLLFGVIPPGVQRAMMARTMTLPDYDRG